MISIVGSVTMTVVFLLAVDGLGASYAELATVGAGAVFTICVAVWVVFTLQDSVLTGLRGATWVLVENGAFGIVKIGLVVVLAAVLPHLGIYVSWMLPVFVAVPLVNALIFSNLVPRHSRLTADYPPPTGRQIGRFLAGDYTGALALLATTNLVPVLVASRLDPRLTAYFFMAWAIAGVLDLLGVNMAMSLTVEGAFDASTISANGRAALRRMAMILVPCVLVVVLLAHWGLGLFGPGYAANGGPVLVFLAIAALPAAAVELYLGMLRAQSRTSLVALVQGVRCFLVLQPHRRPDDPAGDHWCGRGVPGEPDGSGDPHRPRSVAGPHRGQRPAAAHAGGHPVERDAPGRLAGQSTWPCHGRQSPGCVPAGPPAGLLG